MCITKSIPLCSHTLNAKIWYTMDTAFIEYHNISGDNQIEILGSEIYSLTSWMVFCLSCTPAEIFFLKK